MSSGLAGDLEGLEDLVVPLCSLVLPEMPLLTGRIPTESLR